MKSLLFLLVGALCLTGCVTVTYQQMELPSGVTLATHQTVARYASLLEEPCHHLTAQCPNECDHGGIYAIFTIEKYLNYQQFTDEGEPEQASFSIRLWAKDGSAAPETSTALRQTIGELSDGQQVQLNWVHLYRITDKGNFPERIVTLLAE